MRRTHVALIAVVAPLLAAGGQSPKRALTPADWDHWRSIAGAAVSNDGRWAAYSLVPQVGDGEFVVHSTSGATAYRVPRGFIGRPQMVPGGRDTLGLPGGQFTADSRYAVVLTYAPMSDFDRARREKRRPADQPKASLAIVGLADGKVVSVPRVRSFRLAKESGTWLAYSLESEDTAAAGGRRPGADSAARGGAARRETGTTLVLRNLATGAEKRIADVSTYTFDDSAKWLGYTVASRAGDHDGAYALALADERELALHTGRGEYRSVAFDRAGTQAVFAASADSVRGKPRFGIYHAALRAAPAAGANGVAQLIVAPGTLGESIVSGDGRVGFTRAGNAVLFGVAPPPVDSIPADSMYDRAMVDVWNWKDARLQPQQKVEAGRDRARSFQAIYHLATRKLVRLADDSMPTVSVSDDGRVAMAATGERYAVERMWGEGGEDVYVVDGLTGARRLIREKISGQAQLSPGAKYVALFDQGHWFAYGIASGKTVDLSSPAKGVRFDEETWDTPSTPAAYGLAGWTKDDRSVLVYDRYDVWELDPSGVRAPRVVTDSVGRRQHLVFRLAEGTQRGRRGAADADRGVIDPDQPLLLRALDDETKASGFYRDQLGAAKLPEKIIMADAAFGTPLKAEGAEEYVVTRGTFVDFPNLYAGASLASLTRISDANPQQKDFRWGSVELVTWTSADGVPLKGLLYKPEGFDPSKKYPLIAYFYEQLSNNLHQYVAPGGRNVINPTHYVSNGYLIFEPDIHYETGYPGPSALKSIVPGVQALLAKGFVDPNALGLQGQSWGGYQTAFLITQTHMFRAAMAGAPVANMTSAYGGIRWGSGLARSFQYEKTQSRIGGSIWEYPTRYIENSPLFWLDRVDTPLLIMSNDADDAVPWYQGIELFVGMRRLGKEVYLLDYNNDVHNPTKRANQKDVALRMQQFFDHHLRGQPAPEWMTKGIPYRLKGSDQFQSSTAVQAGQPSGVSTKQP